MKNLAEEMSLEFPAVRIADNGRMWEGTAVLDLASILAADLAFSAATNSQENSNLSTVLRAADSKRLQEAREALLRAIAAWSPSVTLEIRIISLPSIRQKTEGRLWITLVIRVSGDCESDAREKTVWTYLNLRSLIAVHWPEAEFYPVTDVRVLECRLSPFDVKWAVGVGRRRESIPLSAPLDKRSPLGFGGCGPLSATADDGIVVDHTYPWIPSLDSWGPLVDLLSSMMEPSVVIIRLRPGADISKTVGEASGAVTMCEAHLARLQERHFPIEKLVIALRDVCLGRIAALLSGGFNVGVFLLSRYPLDHSVARVIGAAISDSKVDSERNPYLGSFQVRDIPFEDALRRDYFVDDESFDAREAACAFRLPSPSVDHVAGLVVKSSRTSLATVSSLCSSDDSAIRLFVNEHRGCRRTISIGADDRMRHMFVAGQTGVGKSHALVNMAAQDVLAGRGVGVIDPHGDAVDKILAAVPSDRVEDVILLDLLDRDRPLGFNPLQWSSPEERDLLIDEFYLMFDRIYDMKATGGPIFETHCRGILRLLMGDKSGKRGDFVPTLLDVVGCYVDGAFRGWLRNSVDDPQVKDFLQEMERAGGEASLPNLSPYITSKFGRFVHDTTLKRIVGQEKSAFDFDDILNNGKIFLVKLGRGRFGSVVSGLLTNMLVSRFKLAAMKRGDRPVGQRRDFFLYVDEAHCLPADNFTELLSEARKFRMGLVLATQYCGQIGNRRGMGAGNDLLAAIHGNVGTTVLFRLGLEDAREMARLLHPRFSERDIVNLPNHCGYARIFTGSEPAIPFSFRTEPFRFPQDGERAEKVRSLSRLKYGVDRNLIDMQISRRRKGLFKRANEDEE